MIRLDDVHFCYREGEPVLAGISLEIPRGLTLVLGPNGAGKSTFLKIVAGVERPDRGVASINGHELWREEIAARQSIAYVPEQPDLTPYATIMDVLKLVCRLRRVPVSSARSALESAGLGQLGNRSIRELSLGQRRRAVLAAAWIGLPQALILDEPLEAMDRTMRGQIITWIERSQARDALVLIATHDLEPFAPRADRALAFQNGRPFLMDSLPADPEARMERLEALSRGQHFGTCGTNRTHGCTNGDQRR